MNPAIGSPVLSRLKNLYARDISYMKIVMWTKHLCMVHGLALEL